MSVREDLDRFMTDKGRALVDQFVAESADEDDDVDFDEVVRQNLADHEAALTGKQPKLPRVPKPFIGYLVENADWTMPTKTPTSWVAQLPLMFVGLKDAQARRAGFQAMAPRTSSKVILKATITFEVVEGGDHG